MSLAKGFKMTSIACYRKYTWVYAWNRNIGGPHLNQFFSENMLHSNFWWDGSLSHCYFNWEN